MRLKNYLTETKKCDHKGKKDLTQRQGKERHMYCPKCKAHWWKGKFYTKKEWDKWMNEKIELDISVGDVILGGRFKNKS